MVDRQRWIRFSYFICPQLTVSSLSKKTTVWLVRLDCLDDLFGSTAHCSSANSAMMSCTQMSRSSCEVSTRNTVIFLSHGLVASCMASSWATRGFFSTWFLKTMEASSDHCLGFTPVKDDRETTVRYAADCRENCTTACDVVELVVEFRYDISDQNQMCAALLGWHHLPASWAVIPWNGSCLNSLIRGLSWVQLTSSCLP